MLAVCHPRVVKVRIGIGLGAIRPDDDVDELIALLEDSGVDSLWLSEVVHAPLLDPVVGMAYVAARTRTMKVGTGVLVLPGRHPLLVAKQLASLARLAPRRVLPVFGLQAARPGERTAFSVGDARRGDVFDEALLLVRRLLAEESVTFSGRFFSVEQAGVGLIPERPLDIWLGGAAPAALRRIGRLADGWLASFVTPEEAAAGIDVIRKAAADAGRTIDEDHYGVSIPVAFGTVPDSLLALARSRRPDGDVADLVPVGWAAAQALVGEFVRAGVSKFVVRPAAPPRSWTGFASEFAAGMLPLQT